jgi:hypothetical protein
MNTTRLISSYGEVSIETPTGKIVETNISEPSYFDDIECFDICEFNDWFFRRYGFQPDLDTLDVLELGYTTKGGKYIVATSWRYKIREELEKEGVLKPYTQKP